MGFFTVTSLLSFHATFRKRSIDVASVMWLIDHMRFFSSTYRLLSSV